MSEIINLRRARKAKTRAEKDKTAEANRVAHGTPKALKDLNRAQEKQAEQRLVGHKLEDGEGNNRSVGESQSDQN